MSVTAKSKTDFPWLLRGVRRAVMASFSLAWAATIAVPCAAQPHYRAHSWRHQTNAFITINEGPVPPQIMIYDVQGSPVIESGFSRADRGEIRSSAWFQHAGSNTNGAGYSVWMEGSMRHTDFTFTCNDGRPSVTTRMRLRIKGHASVLLGNPSVPPNQWAGRAELAVSGMAPNTGEIGIWRSHSGNQFGFPLPASTGIFAGIDADALDGIFLGPSFTAPTNTPVDITVATSLRPIASHASNLNAYVRSELYFNSPGTDGERIGFPLPEPVFELPEGCTCNSVQAKIVDNCWCGTPDSNCPACVVSVQPERWGGVKRLYQ